MIKNWDEHNLNMDFQNIDTPRGKPSDIDLYYLSSTDFLIIGEIKNEIGTFKDGQKGLLKRLIDNHQGGGTILLITHDKYVQNGDRLVDVSKCRVKEYYWNGKWRTPKKPTTVNEAFRKLLDGVF